jgi:hypothetical protein
MKQGIKSIMAIIFFLGTIIYSCTYDEIIPQEVEVPENVSFSIDVQPIFTKSCALPGCHSAGGQQPNLTIGNAYNSLTFFGYVNLADPANSKIYQQINIGKMKTYATDQDRAIILKWMEQGALDN